MDNQNNTASFADLQLNENILKAVAAANYEKPSPIQVSAIPAVFAGRDIFGCAQTGTGKTAAFALPIMQMLDEKGHFPAPKRFRALILTPTRELAEQIATNIVAYGKFLKLSYCKVYGGVAQGPQVKALSKGVDILVATPGRLLDLYRQKKLDFDGVEYLVLDEADRMLDMGFLPDIRRICTALPKKRQSLLFSATLTDEIENLARAIVNDPLKITVSPNKLTVDKITQRVAFVEVENKLNLLEEIMKNRIEKTDDARTLIFCRTKHGANKLSKKLNSMGLDSDAIHGNKSQSARQSALNKFKNRETQVLVATDIAARGIDVKEMSMVINYDLPEDPETYVHRIGRTARAEADGTAISFCATVEVPLLKAIEKFINKTIDEYEENPFLSKTAKAKSMSRITRADIAEAKRRGGGGGSRGSRPQRGGGERGGRGGRPGGSQRPQRHQLRSPEKGEFYGESKAPRADRPQGGEDGAPKAPHKVSFSAGKKFEGKKRSERSEDRGGKSFKFSASREDGARRPSSPKHAKFGGDSFWKSLRAKFAKKRP